MTQSYKAPLCYSDLEKTHTQVLLKGEPAAFRFLSSGLRKYLFLVAVEQSDGSRSCVSWMLKLLSRSDEYSDRHFREDRVAWASFL